MMADSPKIKVDGRVIRGPDPAKLGKVPEGNDGA